MGLSVIIPSRNSDNLITCVGASRGHDPAARIIVVDDGLDPRCHSLLAGFVPGIKPFVYARNINLGIAAAGTDDVILLNDDAMLSTPGGFSLMWEVSKRNPAYGIVAATCNNVGNPMQHPQPQRPGIDLRDEPRTVCFIAVLIPRRVIDLVGTLDEEFVGYGCEDDSYCLRVRMAGFKIGIFDGCYVDHGSLKSSFRNGPEAGGDFTGNLRIFIEKYGVDNWGHGRETSQFRHLFPPL